MPKYNTCITYIHNKMVSDHSLCLCNNNPTDLSHNYSLTHHKLIVPRKDFHTDSFQVGSCIVLNV